MVKYLLNYMNAKEAQEAVEQRDIIVFPIGAVHKHGDGPIGTDCLSCEELARRLGERVPEKVIVLPLLPYGVSTGAVLPGGIDTSYAPVREMIKDVCMSFVKYGIKHILFLTGHGGNDDACLSVASELHKFGVLSAYVRWWDLILQLKGDEDPTYRSIFNIEQDVNAALGFVDPSVLRSGEMRTGAFQDRLRKEIFGDKFPAPGKMEGTVICSGGDPRITHVRHGVVFEGGTVQIPIPRAHVDIKDPEPGEWESIAHLVSAEKGEDILNTCADWLVKFIEEFEKLEIPKEYKEA